MTISIPWSEEETHILLKHKNKKSTLGAIRKSLSDAGYSRTSEAIRSKIIRINAEAETSIIKQLEDPLITLPHSKVKPVKWISGDIPLIPNHLNKFLQLNDVHVPHNIDIGGIIDFIHDFKPDFLLLVGDIVNNDPFSHWDKKSPLLFKTMPKPKNYYQECNEKFYRPIRKAVGQKCKIIHWVGNHENWSSKAVEEMPEGEGYWEVWNNIEEVDSWVKSKGMANLGRLHFTHGDIIKGGKFHADRMLNYFHRNVNYGHYHDYSVISETSPVDQNDRHTAKCCGTLEQLNPIFMQDRPHNWTHCITYGFIEATSKDSEGYGRFYDHVSIITNGKFVANGKKYG